MLSAREERILEESAGEGYARDDQICSMLCGAARLRGRFQDGGAKGEDTARSFEVRGTGSGSGGGAGVGAEARPARQREGCARTGKHRATRTSRPERATAARPREG